MSSSWKTHGRSFKSLVKVNKFPQVDVRADDRGHAPVLRNNFQIYNLPDASGTGAAATTSNSKLEFGKYDFGIEASNNFTLNDAFFGVDASANIQFTDVSGGLGRVGFFFRTAVGAAADTNQNILLTDASGESLLIRLRSHWQPGGDPLVDPTQAIQSQDPSWNYAPGSFSGNIGCPLPQALDTDDPIKGGTLGAVTVEIGGKTGTNNNNTPAVADMFRARQFVKAIGNPYEPTPWGGGETEEDSGYFWTNRDVWKDYPKLNVAAAIFGEDSSSCIVWQLEPKDEPTSAPFDVSYNPDPTEFGDQTVKTPTVIWTDASDVWCPAHPDHPHLGLTKNDTYENGGGSFIGGRLITDISQNITLMDTSGEELIIKLDVDSSYNTTEYDSNNNLIMRDPSWNTTTGNLGTMTLPFGKIFLDWKVGEREESLDNLQRPKASDRANMFISAINRTPWSADISANGYYLEMSAETNPYDTSGGVILTQDYGGVEGNKPIEYDPSENFFGSLPTDISSNDPSSNIIFDGGVNGTDISQNIILSDICGNSVQFELNVDQTFDDASGIHLADNQMDISSVIVPMDNSGNRATGTERATQLATAINKTNFDSFDGSSVDLFLAATTEGGNKIQIYQEYPGVSGNMIPDISYNTPTWLQLFPLTETNQDSSGNYPLKLERNMDPSSGFMGGVDPVDASQTILFTASGENLTTVLFHLDVERQYDSDASGADLIGTNSYEYYVPIGRGLGKRTSEILVSDKLRTERFKSAFDDCSVDPSNISMGGGENNFLLLKTNNLSVGNVIYNINTENRPLPIRMAAAVGGGGEGGYNNSPYPPLPPTDPNTNQITVINIESLNSGAGANQAIEYTPDPNEPGADVGYDETKMYPLLEKSTVTNKIYNSSAISGASNSRPEYDQIIRSQENIVIRGGRHTLVLGDQDKNEIIVESIIDLDSENQLSIPVWELGKGAGTENLNPKYSIQAINPSNTSGVTGAGADYAIAGGFETKAIGYAGVSFGTYCISEGRNSFTMGEACATTLAAEESIALGKDSKCFNKYSCAIGFNAKTGITEMLDNQSSISHNIEDGTGEVIFAVASKSGPFVRPGGNIPYHNVFEIDTNGNVWSQALGPLSDTVTPIKRQTESDIPNTGLYVDYGVQNQQNGVTALGDRAFAIGYVSNAGGKCSFVDGSNCTIETNANFSAIFGENNTITDLAPYSFIAGSDNQALGTNSTVFGDNCSSANYSFSAGSHCDASGDYSVAMGINNETPGFYSVALGGANYAFGESSLALGRNSRALGIISGAIGCHTIAGGAFSVAIGRECVIGSDASNSYCLGAECNILGKESIALGSKSIANGDNCFVGSGGYASEDASNSIAIGYGTKVLEGGAICLGYDSSANNTHSIAIGKNCDISGNFAVGLGFNSQCSGDYSFSVGESCKTIGEHTISVGKECYSYSDGSIALGLNCLAKSSRKIDGTESQTSIALGKRANTSNFAPWVGTFGSLQEPKDPTYKNAPTFRESRNGIIFAIGASGNSVEYTDPNDFAVHSNVDNGNIFEIYGDGSLWTSSIGVLINPADASSVKMVYAIRGNNATPLVKVDAGNHQEPNITPTENIGKGSVILGNNSQSIGNYCLSAGESNRTDASYCVAMGYDCSSAGIGSFALGYECDASNNYSAAFGYGGSTKTSSSGGDISDNDLIFAIGVSSEFLGEVLSGGPDPSNSHYSGNVFEVDKNGSVWTKALGTLSSTIPALGSVPIGGIIPFAGSQSLIAPTNWLWCDGQRINHIDETKYAPLFLVIGTTYTPPNPPAGGFNVPNLQQSWPMGNVDMGNSIGITEGITDVGDVSDIGTNGVGGGGGTVPVVMRWIIRYA